MAFSVDVQRTAVSTSASGTAVITKASFGTPKIILGMMTRHDAATADETAVAGAAFSFGMATDATDEWAIANHSRDGAVDQRGGASWRGQGGFYSLGNTATSSNILEGHIDAMVTDGIRVINETNDNALAAYLLTTFLAGADISNHALVRVNITHGQDDHDFEFGFEPDMIITMFIRQRTLTTSWQTTGDTRLHIGMATNGDATGGGDVQACFSVLEEDEGATVGEPQQSVRSDSLAFMLKESDDLENYRVVLKNFSASTPNGVVVTASGGSSNRSGSMIMLGVKFGGSTEPRLLIRGMPTSTGTEAQTGLGIAPDWGMIVTTAVASGDINGIVLDQKAGRLGISFLDSPGAEGATAINEDGPTTTNTECTTHNLANFLPEDDGGIAAGSTVDARFTSFDSDGLTREFDKVISGYAAQEIQLFIGQAGDGVISMTPRDLESGDLLDMPSLPITVSSTARDLQSGALVDRSALLSTISTTARDLASGLLVDRSALALTSPITARDLRSGILLDFPAMTIGGAIAMLARGLVAGALVDRPVMFLLSPIAARDLVLGAVLDAAAIVSSLSILPRGLVASSEIDPALLSLVSSILPRGLASSAEIDSAVLALTHALLARDLQSGILLDPSDIGAIKLFVRGLVSGLLVGSPELRTIGGPAALPSSTLLVAPPDNAYLVPKPRPDVLPDDDSTHKI